MMNTRKYPVKRSPKREVLEWILTLVLAIGLALAIHMWVGELITVSGRSMEPTLWNNEKVLVGKVEYYYSQPKRGDIIIVRYPDRDENIIKRVVATAGETVSVSGGCAYVNGKELDEPYILEDINGDYADFKVPEGMIFVMGDNRNNSEDSRMSEVGPVPLNKVLGKAYAVVWPVDKWQKLTVYTGKFMS
jgi:signal peptidase I